MPEKRENKVSEMSSSEPKPLLPQKSRSQSETERHNLSREIACKSPLFICKIFCNHPKKCFIAGIVMYVIIFCVTVGMEYRGDYTMFPTKFDDYSLDVWKDIETRRSKAIQARHRISKKILRLDDVEARNITSGVNRLDLIFETKDGSNILQRKHLLAIAKIEKRIHDFGFTFVVCPKKILVSKIVCQEFKSLLRFFDGTYKDLNPSLNDIQYSQITQTLHSALKDRRFNTEVKQLIGTDGIPLTSTKISSRRTRVVIYSEASISDYLWKVYTNHLKPILEDLAKNPPDGLKILYSQFHFVADAAQNQVLYDLLLALGSFLFIYFYACFQTHSIWIGSWTMFMMLGSFFGANLIYRCIVGYQYFGVFHVLSVFIILGIGADDVFVFVETWRSTKYYKYPSFELRFSDAYRKAATSTAITSITTSLAFLVNAFSPLIMVSSFGVFTGLLVIFAYISTVTFLPAVIIMYEHRISTKCLCLGATSETCCLCCCAKEELEGEELKYEEISQLLRCLKVRFFPIVSHEIGKWVILTILLVLACGGGYFASQLEPDDQPIQLFKSNHKYPTARRTRLMGFIDRDDVKVNMHVVWGLKPSGIKGCKPLITTYCRHQVHLDQSFSANSAQFQRALLGVCRELKQSPAIIHKLRIRLDPVTHKPVVYCFIDVLKEYLEKEKNLTIPVTQAQVKKAFSPYAKLGIQITSKNYFDAVIFEWLKRSNFKDKYIYNNIAVGVSPKGSKRPGGIRKKTIIDLIKNWRVSTIGILVKTEVSTLQVTYKEGMELANAWNDYLEKALKQFPNDGKRGFASALKFQFFVMQKSLADGAKTGLIYGIVIAVVVLALATTNIIIALFATFTIGCVTACVIGTIHLFGWKLGVLESINLTLVVGLSVDYVVHLSEAYHRSVYASRVGRVDDAISAVGASVIGGAITTLGATFFMFFAEISFFVQFGVFLFATIAFAFLFSMTFYISLLSALGPQNNAGDLGYMVRMILQKIGLKR